MTSCQCAPVEVVVVCGRGESSAQTGHVFAQTVVFVLVRLKLCFADDVKCLLLTQSRLQRRQLHTKSLVTIGAFSIVYHQTANLARDVIIALPLAQNIFVVRVALRFVHSWVHLTSNIVLLRFRIFVISTLVLTILWGSTIVGLIRQ